MAKSSDNTASFVVRFTQNIFEDENGKSNIQWRGKISHVQGGDDENFLEIQDALSFMQNKLSELTISAIDGKSDEEKEGLLSKSFDIWKKVAKKAPQIVFDTIKDPKAQVSNLQDQLTNVGDEISQKLEIDSWKMASKSDFKTLITKMESMASQLDNLNNTVQKLASKSK